MNFEFKRLGSASNMTVCILIKLLCYAACIVTVPRVLDQTSNISTSWLYPIYSPKTKKRLKDIPATT